MSAGVLHGSAVIYATTIRNIGAVIALAVLAGLAIYAFANLRTARREAGAELELAPNRTPHHPDEVLEGPVLNRNLALGLGSMIVIAVGLPLYWLGEPGRNDGWEETFDRMAVDRGAELFTGEGERGLDCAGCHGGMAAEGGVAQHVLLDDAGDFVATVNWQAPALDTVLLRHGEEALREILVFGRPFSPMPAWGVEGGGPLNEQQVDNLIAYIESIQISPEEAQERATEELERSLEAGEFDSEGEAVFNMGLESGFRGGAYSCGRCHTQGWSYGEPEADGIGAMGPNLADVRSQFSTFAAQVDFIIEGSELGIQYGEHGQGTGRMPGFGLMLTEDQIRAVVEYERNLGGLRP